MPELVANGPVIPVRLMNDLDSRRAVFFCGAGISMDPASSNLPGFDGLVEHVYEHSHLKPDAVEREALHRDECIPADFRRPSYDKALGLLERPNRLGPQSLRRLVIERLAKPPAGRLRSHEALIALSRTAQGVRLVTTNFDNRFVEAGLEEGLVDVSPKLPVPKPHDWSSLVHLHGRIRLDDDGTPVGDGSNLVLTAADLGRAYLTERWAARFVTELFREFTVVFVGYSLDDPVMRYMVDALAAERAKGGRFAAAYAFADYGGEGGPSEERARDGWHAKNVEPILYNPRGDHGLLVATLVEWARIKRDPFHARSRIAIDGISKLPVGARDPLVERVTWALSDPVAAEALADAPPISDESEFPKIEHWLDRFAEAGLLSRPDPVAAGNPPYSANPPVPLVDDGTRTHDPPEPDGVTAALAHWMARHLHVPQVLGWVLRNGGFLHPRLRDLVHRTLADANLKVGIPPKLRHCWTILADSQPPGQWRALRPSRQLGSAASESERRRLEEQILWSIAPRLVVRPGPSSDLELRRLLSRQSGKEPKPLSPIDTCGHLELRAGDAHLRQRNRQVLADEDLLSRHAETLTGYLAHVIALLADIRLSESDDVDLDPSLHRPSIAPHVQNRHRPDWTCLIDLVRDSYFALAADNRARARNLLARWMLSGQPLFRRLALHALTDDPKSDIHLAEKLLLAGRRPGLWEPEIRREVLRFLRQAGTRLPRRLRTQIVRTIHAGPKSKRERSDADYLLREKRLRLRKLERSGVRLDQQSKTLASETEPASQGTAEERDEFISWHGGPRWRSMEEFVPRALITGTVAEVASALASNVIEPIGFESFSQLKSAKAASVLGRLARRGEWPERFWETFLVSIARLRSAEKLSSRLERYVIHLFGTAPGELFARVGLSGADFVKCLAEAWGIKREPEIRALWTKAWTGACEAENTEPGDLFDDNLSRPTGRLAEAAFIRLGKRGYREDTGLPEPIRPYFERIATDPNGHFGRYRLAQRLYQLFSIDSDWTRKYLIPRFDPKNSDEAMDLWSGFAWSARMGPDLFAAIRESFLEILVRYENLGRGKENLVDLFDTICLEAPRELTTDEIRRVVDSFPEAALAAALDSLGRRMMGDSETRAAVWSEKVKPWLEDYWPTAQGRNTIQTSEAMLNLLVECGDAFPNAVSWALSCLTPIEGENLFGLSESGHPANHPNDTLQLLGRIMREDVLVVWNKPTLREILDSMRAAKPDLSAAPEFQRLYRIATS